MNPYDENQNDFKYISCIFTFPPLKYLLKVNYVAYLEYYFLHLFLPNSLFRLFLSLIHLKFHSRELCSGSEDFSVLFSANNQQ